jgi:hypothetical protein
MIKELKSGNTGAMDADATTRAKAIVEEAWRQTCLGGGEFDDYVVPLIASALSSNAGAPLPTTQGDGE